MIVKEIYTKISLFRPKGIPLGNNDSEQKNKLENP